MQPEFEGRGDAEVAAPTADPPEEIGSPPSGFEEGVRLNVYDLINFNMPSGGATLFVSTS